VHSSSYEVYNGATDALLGSTAAHTYVLFGLPAGVYSYYVKALNAGGERSDPSNAITVTSAAVAPAHASPGYRLVPNSNYEISVTGAASAPANVTIPYDPAQVTGDPANLRLLHWNGTAWEDITNSVSTTDHTISGTTTSFSDFSAGEIAAPPVSTPASSPWSIALLSLAGIGVMGASLWAASRARRPLRAH
jgi:hypothetical protein